MKICYPFNQSAENLYANNQNGNGGFYPIGVNNFWHSGIHLYETKPVTAIADGEIIAYRITEHYLEDAPLPITITSLDYNNYLLTNNKLADVYQKSEDEENYIIKPDWDQALKAEMNRLFNITYSNNFVLIKHKPKLINRNSGNEEEIEFFSLYMHLLPRSLFSVDHLSPSFWHKNKYTIDTDVNGGGLKLLSETDTETIGSKTVGKTLGIIPKGSVVEWLEDEELIIFQNNPEHWSYQDTDRYYFVYSPVLEVYGYIQYNGAEVIDSGNTLNGHKLLKINTHKDLPDGSLMGLNLYDNPDLSTAVVKKVLPGNSLIFFENEQEYLEQGDSPSGCLKIRAWKDTGKGITYLEKDAYLEVNKTVVKQTPMYELEMNDIIVLDNPYSIEAGEIIGYPGKYYTNENLLHLEIFSEKKDFLDKFTDDGIRNWCNTFILMESDTDNDNLCDITSFIDEIEEIAQEASEAETLHINTEDNIISRDELILAVKNPVFADKLNSKVVLHPSEWSSESLDPTIMALQEEWGYEEAAKEALCGQIEQLIWWEEVAANATLPPDSSKLYFFHPIKFLEHLQNFTTDAVVTLTYDNADPFRAEPVRLSYGRMDQMFYQSSPAVLDDTGSITFPRVPNGDYYLDFPNLWDSFSRVVIDNKMYYRYRLKEGDTTEGIGTRYGYPQAEWDALDIFIDNATTSFAGKNWSNPAIDTNDLGHDIFIPCHKLEMAPDQTITITPLVSIKLVPGKSNMLKIWDVTIEDRAAECKCCFQVDVFPGRVPVTRTPEVVDSTGAFITNLPGSIPLRDNRTQIIWDGKKPNPASPGTTIVADPGTYKIKLKVQANAGTAPEGERESDEIKIVRIGFTEINFMNSFLLKFHDDVYGSTEGPDTNDYDKDIPVPQWKIPTLDDSPGVRKAEPDIRMELESTVTDYHCYPVCYKRGETFQFELTMAGDNYGTGDKIRITAYHIPDEVEESLFTPEILDKINFVRDENTGLIKITLDDAKRFVEGCYTLVNAKLNTTGSSTFNKYILKDTLSTSDVAKLLEILMAGDIDVFTATDNEDLDTTKKPVFETKDINKLVNRIYMPQEYTLYFFFSYQDGSLWRKIGLQKSSKHTIFTIIKDPQEPWGYSGPLVRPWVSVLHRLCNQTDGWAKDEEDEIKDEDWCAARLVEKMFHSGFVYNTSGGGASEYTDSSSGTDYAELKKWLNFIAGKPASHHNGNLINCTDCGTIMACLANILGCELYSSVFYKTNSRLILEPTGDWTFDRGFRCHQILSIQGTTASVWDYPFSSHYGGTEGWFSYHEIAWKGACLETDKVFDPCLKVANDPVAAPATNDIFCADMEYNTYEPKIVWTPTLTSPKPDDSIPCYRRTSTGLVPYSTPYYINFRKRRVPR